MLYLEQRYDIEIHDSDKIEGTRLISLFTQRITDAYNEKTLWMIHFCTH